SEKSAASSGSASMLVDDVLRKLLVMSDVRAPPELRTLVLGLESTADADFAEASESPECDVVDADGEAVEVESDESAGSAWATAGATTTPNPVAIASAPSHSTPCTRALRPGGCSAAMGALLRVRYFTRAKTLRKSFRA